MDAGSGNIHITDIDFSRFDKVSNVFAPNRSAQKVNIGDVITADWDDNVHIDKLNSKVITSSGVTITDIVCAVCTEDGCWSSQVKAEQIKNNDNPTVDELKFLAEHQPVTKPGFKWESEYGAKTICLDCIFEASFEFKAKMKLGEYKK
jgi:hypothetical protein